jgi:hypothetical protein
MNKINDAQTRNAVFTRAHNYWRSGEIKSAIGVLSEALKVFPNDNGVISELAIALALEGSADSLNRAIAFCERVLSGQSGEKVHHTTRAALCFIYLKAGMKEKARDAARNLPHTRESRETVLAQIHGEPEARDIDAFLTFIAIGETSQQDIILVDFGLNMVPVCTDFDLQGKIKALREEKDAARHGGGLRKLPLIRIRDDSSLSANRIRVRYYADTLLDKEFAHCGEAVNEVMAVLRNISQTRCS